MLRLMIIYLTSDDELWLAGTAHTLHAEGHGLGSLTSLASGFLEAAPFA